MDDLDVFDETDVHGLVRTSKLALDVEIKRCLDLLVYCDPVLWCTEGAGRDWEHTGLSKTSFVKAGLHVVLQ